MFALSAAKASTGRRANYIKLLFVYFILFHYFIFDKIGTRENKEAGGGDRTVEWQGGAKPVQDFFARGEDKEAPTILFTASSTSGAGTTSYPHHCTVR
jgi:hypothetical protein